MIDFSCPGCGKPFSVKNEFVGRKTKCPKCGASLVVPAIAVPLSEPVAPLPPLPSVIQNQPAVDFRSCPFCGEQVLATAKKCKHCGETLDVAMRATEEAARWAEHSGRNQSRDVRPAWNTVRPLAIIGTLLMIFGALGACYYFNMDTTVAVPKTDFMGHSIGGGRVHNIGLMQERQNGLILSLAACGLGLPGFEPGRLSVWRAEDTGLLFTVKGSFGTLFAVHFDTDERILLAGTNVRRETDILDRSPPHGMLTEFDVKRNTIPMWMQTVLSWLFVKCQPNVGGRATVRRQRWIGSTVGTPGEIRTLG